MLRWVFVYHSSSLHLPYHNYSSVFIRFAFCFVMVCRFLILPSPHPFAPSVIHSSVTPPMSAGFTFPPKTFRYLSRSSLEVLPDFVGNEGLYKGFHFYTHKGYGIIAL